MAAYSCCLKGVFESKVHSEEEWDVYTEKGEALYLRSVAKPGTKITKVFPNKSKLRKEFLKRGVNDPKPTAVQMWKRLNFRPILSRFAWESSKGLPLEQPPAAECRARSSNVILDFCRFFTICLTQIGPLVWRTVACLRYLSSKANVNFTFSHLIHLYHPNLIRHGVFTLTARSKKVLVNPEDDRDRGWYIRYVAVRTVDLIGETNIPFPEKWNFEPTMGDVEPIPNFRGWVDSLLKIATREQRTWKSISSLHGWKVKTHGFGIRGMTAEVAMAIRMSANAALDLDKARALLPKRKATKESSEEEEEGTSLITRPRVRRRIVIDDEIENTPARTSATEPVLIQSDEDAEPRDNNESIQHLFDSGFESGELGPVFDEAPLSSLVPISSIPLPTVSVSLPALTPSICLPISTAPISVPLATSTAPASAPVLVSTSFPSIPSIPSAAPLPSVHHTETGSSSGNMSMRSVTLEVPANHSLLRKTGRADVWLEPLIGDIEKKKMESHSCLTLMNDVVHSTLKANLISTELVRRISSLERKARESE
uniref:Uncharacterized protein LOC104220392 n=1 Tax=Nicotiana sylvestris TaxID=4096 RepID=A0A1U7W4K3_NICSY